MEATGFLFFKLCLVVTLAFGSADDVDGPFFIREPPNQVDFSNSTGAVIECAARGSPHPELTWVKQDGTVIGEVQGLRQVLPNGTLIFPPFRAEDYRQEVHAQVYRCLAQNHQGMITSRDVKVRAVVAQSYETQVYDAYVIRGNTALFKCHVPAFVSDQVHVFAWESDDGSMRWSASSNPSHLDGKYLVLPSGELHIRDVGPEDGYKSYKCRTVHKLTGETRLSATAGRLVITEPKTMMPPKRKEGRNVELTSQVEVQGRTVAMVCIVQAHPKPSFRWFHVADGGKKRPVSLNDRVIQVGGTLIIKQATVEDSGKYLCVVNNSVGGESVETVLTVTAPLTANIEPQEQTVEFGRSASMTCLTGGNPIASVTWYKDGSRLNHEGETLTISSVKKEDRGMYQCFVRNDQESAQGTGELKLGGRFDPPVLTATFSEMTKQPGSGRDAFLKCAATGNPRPEITWELDGKPLSNTDRRQLSQQISVNGEVVSHVNITSLHAHDGGVYRCVASSKVGEVAHSAKLNVFGLPYVRPMDPKKVVAGENLIVHCPVAGYPIHSITWERNSRILPVNRRQKVYPNGTLIIEEVERNADQGIYHCVAKNAQGYTAKGDLDISVMVQPEIVPFEFGDEAKEDGGVAQVTCVVRRGDEPLAISWSFHGRDIASNMGINTVKVGSRTSLLSIDRVTAAHSGVFTCSARNSVGEAKFSAELQVNGSANPFLVLSENMLAFLTRTQVLACP